MPALQLDILLEAADTAFSPGDEIAGTVKITALASETARDSVDLYLFWRTTGRGDEDHGVAGHVQLFEKDAPIPPGETERRFEFEAPVIPPTYTGIALKIEWVLGVYARVKDGDKQELEIPLTIKPPKISAP